MSILKKYRSFGKKGIMIAITLFLFPLVALFLKIVFEGGTIIGTLIRSTGTCS